MSDSDSPKRKTQRNTTSGCVQKNDSVLCEELQRVEKIEPATSLLHAKEILASLSTKAAKVAYTFSKVPAKLYSPYFGDNATADVEALSGDDRATILLIHNLKENPCCRCPTDRSVGGVPATIVSVLEPLMSLHPRPTKLSQISTILELLFTFNFIDHRNNEPVDMEKWERCGDYFTIIGAVPLASMLLDPSYVLIRLQGGGSAPAAAINAMNSLPVGGPVGTALSANPVAFPLAATPNATTLPGLFELANKCDAGILIAALRMWGATQEPVVHLELLRFTPDPQGIEFF